MMNFYLVLLTVAVIVIVTSAASNDDGLLVSTTEGYVMGYINDNGIHEWKGIPYAQPPVNELRWEYPQSLLKRDDVYEANYNANGCPQVCKLPPGNCPSYGISEDCLYLSVFAPPTAAASTSLLPVFFWIHGGAYEQGLGNCGLYDGSTFATKDIITVTINYRLGVLGFMASEDMDGNYGFMDQVKALQWVKDNIQSFGGDPDRITIGGQSAGGMSVASLLTSPNSKGMFSQAIMESNPLSLPFHTRESAATNAKHAFDYLDCATNDVACMRTKSVDELLDAQQNSVKLNLNKLFENFLPFAPMIEATGVIPDQPIYSMGRGEMANVPMLSGSMYDEGQLFVYELFSSSLSKVKYDGMIHGTFGKAADTILQAYPFDLIDGNDDGRNVLNVLATDLLFYCSLRNVTRGYTSSSTSASIPSHIYRFKHVLSFDAWGPDYSYCVGVVCHGSELPFVFNVFSADGVTYTPTADELSLASDVSNAWANFIQTGSPNTGTQSIPLSYPLYVTSTDSLIVLDHPDTFVDTDVRSSYCDMWDTLGYIY